MFAVDSDSHQPHVSGQCSPINMPSTVSLSQKLSFFATFSSTQLHFCFFFLPLVFLGLVPIRRPLIKANVDARHKGHKDPMPVLVLRPRWYEGMNVHVELVSMAVSQSEAERKSSIAFESG